MENLIDNLNINQTKRKLVYSMLELMKKKPFEKIHVNEICEFSKVHRTTFYKYFSDKYELLDLCVSSIESILDYNDNSVTYKEYYMNATAKILEIIAHNKDIFKILLDSSENASVAQGIIRKFEKSIVNELTKHNDINEKLNGVDIPPELFAVFYAGGCMAAAAWWFNSNSELSAKELVSHLEKMIIAIDNKNSSDAV